MPRFIFQLQAVLKHRKNLEQQRQRELAVVLAQMQQLQDQLRALDHSVQDATADLRTNHMVGPIDLSFITAHRRFVLGVQARAMGLVQKMALLQRQVDQARAALAEAAKARKIMEKLRERHFERWKAALGARELAELDEIGMQLAYRHATDNAE